MRKFLYLWLMLCTLFFHDTLAGTVLSQDIQIILNSLKYVRGLDRNASDEVQLAILYDPLNPSSKEEAETFISELTRITQAKPLKLKAQLVAIDAFNASTDAHLAYVTHGLQKHHQSIYAIAKEQHIFTLSKDLECAQGQSCILSVQTSSGIEIFLNEATMRALGFEVDAAFKFMSKRL